MDVFTYGMDRWMMYSIPSPLLPPHAHIDGGPLPMPAMYMSHTRRDHIWDTVVSAVIEILWIWSFELLDAYVYFFPMQGPL